MMQMSLYATKEAAKEYEKFKSDAKIFCILILISFLYWLFSANLVLVQMFLQTLLFWCKCRPISVDCWSLALQDDQRSVLIMQRMFFCC